MIPPPPLPALAALEPLHFAFAGFALILLAIVVLAIRRSGRADLAWREVGERLGLEYTKPRLGQRRSLHGELRGYPVEARVVRVRRGDHRRSFTDYRLGFESLGLGLRLGRQGAFAGLARLLGQGDIELGDEPFDTNVDVRGEDEEAIAAFLTPERRARILQLLTSERTCRIHDAGIEVRTFGIVTSADRLATTLLRCAHLADALLGRADGEFAAGVEAEREGDLGRAAEHYGAAPASSGRAPDVDRRARLAELYVSAGQMEQARALLEELERELPPGDERLASLAELLARPPERPQELIRPELVPGALAALCDDVFAPGLMTGESNRRFEERYAGRPVSWRGVLVGARPYATDFVFGREPGVRARFHVHTLKGDAYGEREVHAVVALPRGLEDDLERLEGEACAFEGRLSACDPFMRLLFVERGQLTARPAHV